MHVAPHPCLAPCVFALEVESGGHVSPVHSQPLTVSASGLSGSRSVLASSFPVPFPSKSFSQSSSHCLAVMHSPFAHTGAAAGHSHLGTHCFEQRGAGVSHVFVHMEPQSFHTRPPVHFISLSSPFSSLPLLGARLV